MKAIPVKIPYGKGSIAFSIPRSRLIGRLGQRGRSHGGTGALVSKAFAQPSDGMDVIGGRSWRGQMFLEFCVPLMYHQ